MILLSFDDLVHLSPEEIYDLDHLILQLLQHLEAGTVARSNALASLENIRRVRVYRNLHL